MRTLILPASSGPRERGRIHGESFRGEIGTLADLRVYLTLKLSRMSDRVQVLDLASQHVEVLKRYDANLAEELLGIAEGANLTPSEIVVLNHYTDLRDIDPDELAFAEIGDDGCSVLYARAPAGPILAQTWDMHASAAPYTMMMRVEEEDDREAWVLTLTGCLGMTGMNRAGVGISINNLHSTDARIGVVWSALVRKALLQRSALAARDLVLKSPVGSGHHYVVADANDAFGIETSGTLRKVIYAGETPSYVHTNHCLDDEVAARNRVPEASTTRDRLGWLMASAAAEPVSDLEDAWSRIGSDEGYPRSVCTNMATPERPHAAATCAGIAMDLASRRILAVGGLTHNVTPDEFGFVGPPT